VTQPIQPDPPPPPGPSFDEAVLERDRPHDWHGSERLDERQWNARLREELRPLVESLERLRERGMLE
jgi:hypothetical protein